MYAQIHQDKCETITTIRIMHERNTQQRRSKKLRSQLGLCLPERPHQFHHQQGNQQQQQKGRFLRAEEKSGPRSGTIHTYVSGGMKEYKD
jgi:hypothetical protein